MSWTLLGVALPLLGLWVRAERWRYLFPPRSNPVGLVPAVMIGYMANNVLPLRAGELIRVYVVARRRKHGFWTTLATLIVERVLDSLVIVLVLAILVLIIPVPPLLRWAAVVIFAVDVVAIGLLGLLAAAPAFCERLVTSLTRRWPGIERRLASFIETFTLGLDGIRDRRHAVPLVVWTVLVWIVPAAQAWIMLRALNLNLPLAAGWAVLAFVGLGISIPSAPGYIGVFHYATVLATEIFGVPRAAALGYALVLHASQMVPVTLAGWVCLMREHVSLAEATRTPGAQTPLIS